MVGFHTVRCSSKWSKKVKREQKKLRKVIYFIFFWTTFFSKSMFRPLWAPQAIYIRPNKIGCSAMEVHLERVNNATLNRVPISYSWPPTNNVIRKKLKYHEYELAEKKILWKYHVYVFFNITPSDAFVFTDLTFWGDSSAFPFYELPLVLCTNFPPFHNN